MSWVFTWNCSTFLVNPQLPFIHKKGVPEPVGHMITHDAVSTRLQAMHPVARRSWGTYRSSFSPFFLPLAWQRVCLAFICNRSGLRPPRSKTHSSSPCRSRQHLRFPQSRLFTDRSTFFAFSIPSLPTVSLLRQAPCRLFLSCLLVLNGTWRPHHKACGPCSCPYPLWDTGSRITSPFQTVM